MKVFLVHISSLRQYKARQGSVLLNEGNSIKVTTCHGAGVFPQTYFRLHSSTNTFIVTS
ncbi:hypothetical protein [Flavisolibacter tropicus]|uniref:hypothetical protein n=1 Tax=Flavisolibacter tropicus TaxID=1492898 RepID=UPI00131414D1|nr:hypothetical protein [Flavisolibacter tropicus]